MEIRSITIEGGQNKSGEKETIDKIILRMGDIVSVVGPTGCGKTTLINDVELCANCNTPSKRKIYFNDSLRMDELIMQNPAHNPVAYISQHTNFLSDLSVKNFLEIHANVRNSGKDVKNLVEETLKFANQLTGEPLNLESSMTELSGGQTRSLLIADAVTIGNAPIILLDEIENAGIHRNRALELLKKYNKIFIFVTHDPRIALFCDYRIVMRNGGICKVLFKNKNEEILAEKIKKIDDYFLLIRSKLRNGDEFTMQDFSEEILSF